MSNIFTPRTTAPDPYSPYWQKTTYGGYNKFNTQGMYPGCVLPNCTGYAEGRWMEILDWTSTNLPFMNATNWYGHTSDGYPRGQDPRIGAVICWRTWDENGVEDRGHVGIVEKIIYDGNGNVDHIEVSWSADNGAYFTYRTNINAPDFKYKTRSELQGFIYCPDQPIAIDSNEGIALMLRRRRKLYRKNY